MIQSQQQAATLDQPDSAAPRLERAADGRMWLDAEYRVPLERAGLGGFRAVMHSDEGECLRALADRENWRLQLDRPGVGHVCSVPANQRHAANAPHESSGARGTFYLKKHHVRTLGSILRAAVGAAAGETAGRTEAENVQRLAAAGIGAMRVVAFGEELHGDGRLESFLLSEDLEGFEPLDDFLRRRFAPISAGRRTDRDQRLGRLLAEVAKAARTFHRAGYNHRDFYCCHFFVREEAAGRFEIRLIDLQRMQHRRRFRRRWLVKDLAQLAYSAPRDRVGCTQRLAFMRLYLGVGKLRPGDKRLIRRVLGKQKRMERRRGTSA